MNRDALCRYFESKFVADLDAYQAESLEALYGLGIPSPEKCKHHQVPNCRIIPFDTRLSIPDRPQEFWVSWYATTLVHAAVHRYARDQEIAWLQRSGSHSLPMVPKGLGCWKVAKPASLLTRREEYASLAPDVFDRLGAKVEACLLQSMIEPSELSRRLLADPDLTLQYPVERFVAKCISEWRALETVLE